MTLQKSSQCEGWLMRSPEAQPMWGMADAFPRRQRMWGASWYFTYTYYQCPWLLIIDYCYFKLYTTTLHHYSPLIIAILSHILLIVIIALTQRDRPLQVGNNYPAPLPCLRRHQYTRKPDWYLQLTTALPTAQEHIAKKLQHRYIEPAKREIHWDKDNVLRIWERNAITLQLYKERSKLWGPIN